MKFSLCIGLNQSRYLAVLECLVKLSLFLCAGLADNEDKSDVQAIIESTPELDMDLSGYKGSR